MRIIKLALIILPLFFGCIAKVDNNQADIIPFRTSLQEANVTLTQMEDGQHESLILGNGDFYGIVWTKDNNLFMRITKNDIWDARVNTSEDGELPKVNITTHEVTGSVGAPPGWNYLYPQPRCAAALQLGPSPKAITAHLDLEKAFVSIKSEDKPNTEIRILHNKNVLLVKSPNAVILEEIKAETLPDATLGKTGDVSWLLMKMPGDIDYNGMDYALAVATQGDLKAVSLVSSFDIVDGDVLKHAIELAKNTIALQEETLITKHEQAWQNFWSQSGVQLDDKKMQNWWYRMLYFAQTVARPGAQPVGLLPPLATDNTPWHADYHHNYNTWQGYWPLPAANHPELADPWISYNNKMIPRYRNLAKVTYGIDGLHVPISSFLHEPDPANCSSKNKRQMSMNPWGLTIGLAGMTLQSMWQKYLCDQDIEYMREKIYPFVKETAHFYVSFMEKCQMDDNGKIRLGPSYSPEHPPMGIFNCPFDIAYVHYTFDALIEAAHVLQKDKDLAGLCEKYKALLSDYPTALNDKGEPIVVDWTGCQYKQIKEHNITVPVSPVFPGDQVTWFSPEAEKELFRRTINETNFRDHNSHVMFNIARARLSMPEGVSEARKWFASRELSNGLFMWAGHAHGTFMPEMIGVAALINEFLLQSVQNKIRLFPCWPNDKNAKFSQLRAQGGFIVSAEYKDGRVSSATIQSVADKQLQLLSPWETIYINGKEATIDSTGLVTIDTKSGQVFQFSETNN
ncbi:hypothetical protein N9164_02625 [Draconibacterium sp.]|nr:hypothetical protein [Draconibacterium sp.]